MCFNSRVKAVNFALLTSSSKTNASYMFFVVLRGGKITAGDQRATMTEI